MSLRHCVLGSKNILTFVYRIGSYFGDLGDGIHKGDENDPRVAVIEVVPDEIRYWLPMATRGVALKGEVNAPGELRTITNEEVSALEGIHIFTDPSAPRSNSLRKKVRKQNSGRHPNIVFYFIFKKFYCTL